MQLTDSHCHLTAEPLRSDLDGVMARAQQAGVRAVVVPAYDVDSWEKVARLSCGRGLHLAFGLHPWYAEERLDLGRLGSLLELEGVVAIGEIGLDSKIDSPTAARQLEVLEAQLALAVERDLPVLLHCRGAFEELLAACARHAPRLRGVLHAFSRGPELAARFLDLGLAVAFGGAVTQPRAERARRAAARVPLERMLLETDAPSIALAGVPAEQVEPRHVADVAAAVAALRGIPIEDVAERTTEHARRLFGID